MQRDEEVAHEPHHHGVVQNTVMVICALLAVGGGSLVTAAHSEQWRVLVFIPCVVLELVAYWWRLPIAASVAGAMVLASVDVAYQGMVLGDVYCLVGYITILCGTMGGFFASLHWSAVRQVAMENTLMVPTCIVVPLLLVGNCFLWIASNDAQAHPDRLSLSFLAVVLLYGSILDARDTLDFAFAGAGFVLPTCIIEVVVAGDFLEIYAYVLCGVGTVFLMGLHLIRLFLPSTTKQSELTCCCVHPSCSTGTSVTTYLLLPCALISAVGCGIILFGHHKHEEIQAERNAAFFIASTAFLNIGHYLCQLPALGILAAALICSGFGTPLIDQLVQWDVDHASSPFLQTGYVMLLAGTLTSFLLPILQRPVKVDRSSVIGVIIGIFLIVGNVCLWAASGTYRSEFGVQGGEGDAFPLVPCAIGMVYIAGNTGGNRVALRLAALSSAFVLHAYWELMELAEVGGRMLGTLLINTCFLCLTCHYCTTLYRDMMADTAEMTSGYYRRYSASV